MQPHRHPAWRPPPTRPDGASPERDPTDVDRAGGRPPGPEGWPPPPPPPLARRAYGLVRNYAFGAVVLALTAMLLLLLYLTWGTTDPSAQNLDRLVRELETGSPRSAPTSEPAALPQHAEATLSVMSDPEGAVVLLDGDTLGVTPLRGRPVDGGVYVLSVREARHEPRDTVLYLAEGQAVNVLLPLSPSDPGATDVYAAAERPSESEPPEAVALGEAVAAGAAPEEEASEEDLIEEIEEETSEEEVIGEEALEEEAFEEEALEEDEEEAPPELGQLLITSEPARAEVWLDGQRVGATPLLRRDVQPGSYAVTLRRDGYAPFTTSVELRPGQRIASVSSRLEERFGTLTLLVRPWGTIYVDGKLHRRDTDAEYELRLPTGPHEVRVVHPTLGTWEGTVEVEAEEAQRVEITLPASPNPE